MGRDRKLKAALDRYKGVDYKLQKQKKMQKEAEKRKRKRQQIPEENYMMSGALVPSEEKQDPVSKQVNGDIPRENGAAVAEEARNIWDTEEEDEDEEDRPQELDISKLDDSDSSDSDEDEDREDAEDEPPLNGTKEASIAEEEDGEEDIPLSDIASVTSEEKGDIVPHQRLTINNHTALLAAHKRIVLSLSKLPFSAHQSVTASEPTTIPDIDDDLNRELAFYKQALTAVQTARDILKKEGMPFSRPADYFAEMVKSDEHMGRVKQKLVDAAASKKAAQDARRQRDLKKFGKQVQVEKRQEREREKREMLERVQRLKRKRANAPLTNENEPDLFDVELEDEDDSRSKRRRPDGAPVDGKRQAKAKRQAKDKRYGFGGKKRFSKSGDAFSSSDMRGFSAARMKGKAGGKAGKMRPGKSRRAKGRV